MAVISFRGWLDVHCPGSYQRLLSRVWHDSVSVMGQIMTDIMFYEEVVSLACHYRGLPGDTTWEEIRRRLNDKFLATLSTEAPCPAPLPPLPCEFAELPDFSGLIMMTDDSQPLAPAVNTNTAEVLCSDLSLGGANTSSTSPTVGVKFKFKSSTAE